LTIKRRLGESRFTSIIPDRTQRPGQHRDLEQLPHSRIRNDNGSAPDLRKPDQAQIDDWPPRHKARPT